MILSKRFYLLDQTNRPIACVIKEGDVFIVCDLNGKELFRTPNIRVKDAIRRALLTLSCIVV